MEIIQENLFPSRSLIDELGSGIEEFTLRFWIDTAGTVYKVDYHMYSPGNELEYQLNKMFLGRKGWVPAYLNQKKRLDWVLLPVRLEINDYQVLVDPLGFPVSMGSDEKTKWLRYIIAGSAVIAIAWLFRDLFNRI